METFQNISNDFLYVKMNKEDNGKSLIKSLFYLVRINSMDLYSLIHLLNLHQPHDKLIVQAS